MAKVLIIDDDNSICELVAAKMTRLGHETTTGGCLSEGLELARKGRFDVVFLDLNLPDGHGLNVLPKLREMPGRPEVVIITGAGDPDGAEKAFKYGAWDFVQKPLSMAGLALSLTRVLQYREEKKANQRKFLLKSDKVIGSSPAIKQCLNQVVQAAASEAGVLLTGSTGVGKELMARVIHENSSRAQNEFVVVDCAALPETLVESLLFGHVKGSFTGADHDAGGLVGHAHQGVLFLDEVGELPLAMQKAFLRVLQEHCYRPVGSKKERKSDFRLLAATNRDLGKLAALGGFRSDLLYRLGAMRINVPDLSHRRQDIYELTLHYIARNCKEQNKPIKGFSPEFLDCLEQYDWPGNVRELKNTLETALAQALDSPTLYPLHLPAHLRLSGLPQSEKTSSQECASTPQPAFSQGKIPSIRDYRAEMDATYLRNLMVHTNGKVKEAAKIAGLSESRMHALLNKHGAPRLRK